VVLRTAVPEAAVEEHRYPDRPEHHVGGSPKRWEGPRCDPVAQSERVDGAA